MNTIEAPTAYPLMRSLARLSASHSSSAGCRLKRLAPSEAPGSMSTDVAPHCTSVATERTPIESAASGITFMGAHSPRSSRPSPRRLAHVHDAAARALDQLLGREREHALGHAGRRIDEIVLQ